MAALNSRPQAGSEAALAGQVIVLLEDDDLIRRATERMLRRFGAEVITAGNSRDALTTASERSLTPSCVIADYWLTPEENGLSAVTAIREATGGTLHGLIITGDLSREIADAVALAGFVLLRKPVDVNKFIDAIARST